MKPSLATLRLARAILASAHVKVLNQRAAEAEVAAVLIQTITATFPDRPDDPDSHDGLVAYGEACQEWAAQLAPDAFLA